MNERAKLMRMLSAAQFALWEMHMYLDTHPFDKEAIALFKKHEMRYAELKKAYEEEYGPLTIRGEGMPVKWLENPWPWDYDRED